MGNRDKADKAGLAGPTDKQDPLLPDQDRAVLAGAAVADNVAVLEEEGKSAGLYLAELNMEVSKLRLEHELLDKGISSRSASEATNGMASAFQQTNAVPESNASNIVFTASDTALKSARVELGMRRAERDQLQKDRGEMAGA